MDLAEADAMESLLKAEIARRGGQKGSGEHRWALCLLPELMVVLSLLPKGVDVEAAKRAEEELLLHDTRCWLNGGAMPEARHPRTGASALHVAAAKGYMEVMRYGGSPPLPPLPLETLKAGWLLRPKPTWDAAFPPYLRLGGFTVYKAPL